tara:strand:- start:317 stop:637 length:321 start_codon:yes stop_codon:yes gene_type:complete
MTVYYQTNSWNSQPQPTEDRLELWNHIANKANWRIVQLPNGYYQTEYKDIDCLCDPEKDGCCEKWNDVTRRETMEAAETSIDSTIEHYNKKLEFIKGPKVVKTFKK